MGIELQPGQSCYEARAHGCTCAWLRGFGVDPREPTEWAERIIDTDEGCPVHPHKSG